MKLYIGFDNREQDAYAVADYSARKFGLDPEPLYEERLRMHGMLYRIVDRRAQMYDLISGAPQSTEFAASRFWVPLLAHSGWAMFVDCDVLFMCDPKPYLKDLNPGKAVYCVKHKEFKTEKEVARNAMQYTYGARKMDNQVQTIYPRKLWSSVMVFNCDHPANQRLNLMTLNGWPGRYLHGFGWLADEEIGELPAEFNWLVNLQPKPETPIIAHYTLGTPNIVGNQNIDTEHAELWFNEFNEMKEAV